MDKELTIAVLLGELINPRMEKRIRAECEIADVHLISWDRGSNMLDRPSEDGYQAHTILLKAKGDPIRRMLPYRRFIEFAKGQLVSIKPNIIHAQNLDMLKIAVWYKQKVNSNVHLIYEIADLHKLLVDKQSSIVRRIAQKYLLREDRRCSQYIDLLVVTSEKYYETYFKDFIPNNKVLFMPNVPDLSAFKDYRRKERNDNFVVGFIGAIRYKQQMKNLIEAGRKSGVKVLFAGVEYAPVEIEPLCKAEEEFEWYGKFDFKSEAAKIYEKCDAVYSVYDADMENVKVALPNKLYEAIYCEIPIIVAKGTYLSELVESWGVGVSVNHKSVDDLASSIVQLRDNTAEYYKMVENCRKMKGIIDLVRNNKEFTDCIKRMIDL